MIRLNGYSAECDSLKELITAVKKLPSTIEFINVQCSLSNFNPESIKLNWSNDLASMCEVIIDEALQEQDRFGLVDKFYLNSYYGEGKEDHCYYIKLESDKSRDFGQKMSSGYYGRTD